MAFLEVPPKTVRIECRTMAAPTDRLERIMPSGCLEDMRCAPKAVTGVAHRVASLLTAKGSTDRDGVRGSVRRSRGWSAQALSLTGSANAPWDRSILREPIRRRSEEPRVGDEGGS